MFDEFRREPRWAGVRFIKGLLDKAPAISLELSAIDGDFGADDIAGTPIELLVPRLQHPGAHPVHVPGPRRLLRLCLARLRPQVFLLRRPQAGRRPA